MFLKFKDIIKRNMSYQKKLVSNRVDGMSESIWVEFVQLALDHKPVNLGQGFPDFEAPECVRKGLADAAIGPNNVVLNQYTRGFVDFNVLM